MSDPEQLTPAEKAAKEVSSWFGTGAPLEYLKGHYTAPDLLPLLQQVEKDAIRFGELPEGSENMDLRKERRELWERFVTHYWSLAWTMAERRSKLDEGKGAPDALRFAPEEKLFFNFGVLDARVTPAELSELALEAAEEPPLDGWQYMRFVDWFGEAFALYFGRQLPGTERGLSLGARVECMEKRLEAQSRRRSGLQKVLLGHLGFPSAPEAEKLLADLDKMLIDHIEATVRTQRFRLTDDRSREKMRDASAAYTHGKERLFALLEQIRTVAEANNLMDQFNQISTLTADVEKSGELLVHLREELRRQKEKVARFAEKFKGKGEGELRLELQEGFKKKRMFVEMAARRSKLHVSPLYASSLTPPNTFAELSRSLAEISAYDPGLFASRRIRVHGFPRVCIMPGRGNGVYDWEDHMLLFPLFPASTVPRAVAQAMALFRWDADDDRDLKDTYGNIKDNRGKSISGLQESFCRDYLVWVTKEVKGYRVLAKDTYNWFNWKIAGGSELGADVGNKG